MELGRGRVERGGESQESSDKIKTLFCFARRKITSLSRELCLLSLATGTVQWVMSSPRLLMMVSRIRAIDAYPYTIPVCK